MEATLVSDHLIDRQVSAAKDIMDAVATMLEGQRMLGEAAFGFTRATTETSFRLGQTLVSTGLAYSRLAAAASGESFERWTSSVIPSAATAVPAAPAGGRSPATRSKEPAAA